MPLRDAPDAHIPIPWWRLREAVLADPDFAALNAEEMKELFHWLLRLFHVQFFDHRERLKYLYMRFDPDRPQDREGAPDTETETFLDELGDVLKAGNFRRLRTEDIQAVDHRNGRLGARIKVVENIFDQVRFYGRGRTARTIRVKRWFGLRRQPIEAVTYDQVMFCAVVAENAKPALLKRWRLREDGIYLKLFRDIARGDLQTLYPNARMVMPLHFQLMMGVPAVIAGVPLMLKIIPSLSILLVVIAAYLGISGSVEDDTLKKGLAAGAAIGAVIGFGSRQWTSYARYDLKNQKEVVENAYYNKLNANAATFDTLISGAEDSDVKEAILAYTFLASARGPMQRDAVDAAVENWVARETGIEIDFEIDDALAKLRHLGLLKETEAGLQVESLPRAIASCRETWISLADHVARPEAEDMATVSGTLA